MTNPTSSNVPTAPTKRRWWIPALALLVVVAVVASLALRQKADAQSRNSKDDKAKVVPLVFGPAEVTRPLRSTMPQVIEFSGPLVAPRTAVVRAKANGTLITLDVAEGSRVKAGQVLGTIDLAELQSRVTDRGAMVESAEATLAEAKRQHEANLRLADQNFISPTALQTSQARLDAARASLKSAQAQLSTSRIGIRDAALVAPIAGIVGKRHVVPGERVSSEQNIVTIVDLTTLELMGTVGTHEVSALQVGQPVALKIEGHQDEKSAANRARIDRIAPAAETGTRAIGVVVALDNKGERLRAGQYGQARVTLADETQRLTLPLSAVTQASGQDQVWTIEKGALVRRIVITGRRDVAAGRVEVLQGLAEGATVLANRFDNLKEGALASVGAAAGTASPAAAAAPASSAPKS